MNALARTLPTPERIAADAVHSLLRALGEDPDRDGLKRTPERVASALAQLTAGAQQRPQDVLNGAIFGEQCEEMVLVRSIEFFSLCEHHMLPFHGTAHVAYLPAGRILGLSKLPRLIDVFARRLQVQERLTRQIADAVQEAIAPRGVAVMLDAAHFCMMMRGVQKQLSRTSTFAYRGEFETSATRRTEFLAAARGFTVD
jgi:GTP cyclohydrolase IA